MAGQFLKEKELYDLKKSEERTKALQKRKGQENYHVETKVCGCPCPTCGGWHEIDENRPLPTKEACTAILRKHNRSKKQHNS